MKNLEADNIALLLGFQKNEISERVSTRQLAIMEKTEHNRSTLLKIWRTNCGITTFTKPIPNWR